VRWGEKVDAGRKSGRRRIDGREQMRLQGQGEELEERKKKGVAGCVREEGVCQKHRAAEQ